MRVNVNILVLILVIISVNIYFSSMFSSRHEKTCHRIYNNKKEFLAAQQAKSSLNIEPLRVGFMGVEKCGTQTIYEFTNQHPDVHFLKGGHVCKDVSIYSNEMKAVERKYRVVAFRDNSCWKNVNSFDNDEHLKPQKIVLLLCDPVFRAFSMYMHQLDLNPDKLDYKTFGEYVVNEIAFLERNKYKIEEGTHKFKHFDEWINYGNIGAIPIVGLGIFSPKLREFLKRYKKEDILVLSGEELIERPGNFMLKLESFLKIPPLIAEHSFYKNDTTGYFCMINPKFEQFCMYKKVSRTRGEDKPTPEVSAVTALRDFFRPYNKELFQMLNQTFDWI